MANVPITDILDSAGFQISTICICGSCIYYTMVHQKPEKLQNKVFLVIFSNVLITAICNLISALVKPYTASDDFLFSVTKVSQYIYFLFHTLLAPLFCFYIALVTGATHRLKRSFKIIYNLPVVAIFLLVITNPITHFVYYHNTERQFTRNWAEYIIYGISVVYYLLAIFIIFLYWKAVTLKIKRVLFYSYSTVLAGTAIQLVIPSFHTELFAEALAMTAMMVTVENEEDRKDSRTKIYNYAALAFDVTKNIKINKSFFIVCIKMNNPMGMMQLIGPANIEKLTELTADYLATLVPKYTIYYIGTGTFVIMNVDKDREFNIKLAKTIKERFNHSWHFQDRDTVFSCSVFCAEVPTDFKTPKEIMMLVNSPIPPNATKSDGIFYGSSLNYILRRSKVEEAIANGFKNKGFEVYYQPIYNASDMTICAGEALLRLHDRDNGEIYPDEFLPIAERSGMIFELGDFVLDEVCKFLNSGIPTEMGIDTLNINLSVIQCIQSNYAERIISLVSKYDISPSRITFEITESAATTDFAALKAFVTKLRAHGFRFTVDDYGIGYSNVHSIFSLDVEIIKIDRTILWEAEQTETGRIIMVSSVDMIKRMGKKILITGVETKPQIDMATEFGVDYLQGYYFSNPITQNEFIGILKATQIARFEEQKALAASEAMSNFLANMSHEIRTPINAVLGMDEMILRESDDDRIIEYARTIEGAGRTLLSLINDILDFSKIEAGNVELVENEYELSSMLSDVINMIEIRAESKGLNLVVDINPVTPGRLYGDETRIRQIMLNLLNNAVKYTESGTIALRLSFDLIDESHIYLKFSVKDTGIGIKEEDLNHLFEKFRRLDLDKNKTIEGSGLGLAITHQLLKLMDGDIKVESTYGKGSTFFARIPQKIISKASIGDFNAKPTIDTKIESYKESFHASNATILVVDDTPMNLIVVRELLKETKINIDEAGSGKACLEMCGKKAYDIIFLDYRMPEMDGIETLKKLKEMTDCPNINTPVIALTANAIAGARERFLGEGFDDYITKPINGERLEKILLMHLPVDKIDKPEKAGKSNGSVAAPLDVKTGVANCGSEEAYKNVLKAFRDEIQARAEVIRTSLDNNDIKRYVVEVHAIKSSARIIGASELSELALKLEEAGNNGDIETINEDTPKLLQLYESYADKQKPKAPKKNNSLPLLSKAEWEDALVTFKEFAASMDYDNSIAIVDSLKGYMMEDAEMKALADIEALVRRLEWDQLKSYIDKL